MAEAHISVQHAFSGGEIASIVLPATHSVYELKLRLEETTEIPAEYQTLLRPGEVVPLRDASTLFEEGLSPQSTVLFTHREPKHADLELWETCQGCRCNFGEKGIDQPHCNDLSEKLCGCKATAGNSPRMVKVRYLHRYLSNDARLLQILFERCVLAGGSDAYTAAARHLVEDPRIDANVTGCSCAYYPTLLEIALSKGHFDMCRMLIESGRLSIEVDAIRNRLQADRDDCRGDDAFLKLLQFVPDFRDPTANLNSILEVANDRDRSVCKIIKEHGLQKHPWCRKYLGGYRKAIACVVEDILWVAGEDRDSNALDPYDAPVCSGHLTRKQRTLLAGRHAKTSKRHFCASELGGKFERSQPMRRVRRAKRT